MIGWFLISWSHALKIDSIQPGVYIENLGEVHVLDKKIELWFKMDLNDLESEIKKIEKFRFTVSESCRIEKQRSLNDPCRNFLQLSELMLGELRVKFRKIVKERNKRGLVNAVGGIGRFLFGTMDDNDRENIDKKFEKLSDDNKRLTKFTFDYSKLIEKTVANFNTTVEICNRNNRLINEIQNKFNILQIEFENSLEFSSFMREIEQTFIIMIMETTRKIDELTDTIIDIHNEVFNTKLIGYEDIIKAIKEVRINDKQLSIPISFTNPDYEMLRKLMKFGFYKKENELFLIYLLPLVRDIHLNIFKIFPVPEISNNLATFVELGKELILTDPHFDKFIKVGESKIKDCAKIKKQYFCENINLLRHNSEDCDITMITGNSKNAKKNCKFSSVEMIESVVLETSEKNKFLVFSPSEETGILVNENGSTPLSFVGTQILEIKEEAVLNLNNYQIKFVGNNVKTETAITFNKIEIPKFDLKLREKITLPKIKESKILNKDEFIELGKSWHELNSQFEEIENDESKTKIFYIAFIIISIVAIIVIAIIILIRKTKKKRTENNENVIDDTQSVILGLQPDARGRASSEGGGCNNG